MEETENTTPQQVVNRWKIVASSVQGTSHDKTKQPCQDAHGWKHFSDDVLIATVADGAGSASLGEVGAEIACKIARQKVEEEFCECGLPKDDESWKRYLVTALEAARAAVEAEADARKTSPRELATTLILAVATPQLVAVAQIGDGAAVVSNGDGDIAALTIPQNGEYINETTFIISPNAIETAQLTVWHGATAQIAAFSDGLQMLALKLPLGVPHAPFFAPLFRFVENSTDEKEAEQELQSFLRSPRIRERADDDLTLLLASL